jgi:hypothetical protein
MYEYRGVHVQGVYDQSAVCQALIYYKYGQEYFDAVEQQQLEAMSVVGRHDWMKVPSPDVSEPSIVQLQMWQCWSDGMAVYRIMSKHRSTGVEFTTLVFTTQLGIKLFGKVAKL